MAESLFLSDESCYKERGIGGCPPARNGEQDDGGRTHGIQISSGSQVACCTDGEDCRNGGEEEREESRQSGADGNHRQWQKRLEHDHSKESRIQKAPFPVE